MVLLISNWDYSVAGAESLTEQPQEEAWSPEAGLSRCTPRVLQPANVRLMFFPFLTGRFYVLITLSTAAFSSIAYSIKTKITLGFSASGQVAFLPAVCRNILGHRLTVLAWPVYELLSACF